MTKREIEQHLKASRAELEALMASLSEADLARTSRAEAWTVKDLLAHLASAESGIHAVIQRIRKGDTQLRAGFDLNIWNQRQVEKRRDAAVSDFQAELRASREGTWQLLAEVPEADFPLRGIHSSGEDMSVEELFRRIGDHEREHGSMVREALGR